MRYGAAASGRKRHLLLTLTVGGEARTDIWGLSFCGRDLACEVTEAFGEVCGLCERTLAARTLEPRSS